MDNPQYDEVNGEFRGWLCQSCNLVLGHAKDDPQILRNAIHYLEKGTHNATH